MVFVTGSFLRGRLEVREHFLIVAFALFLVVRQINRLTAPKAIEKPGDPPPPENIVLLREIRDLLKSGK